MGNEIIYSEKDLDSEEIKEAASKNGTPTFSGSSTLNNKEKDIYLYMKQVYDELTNYGENYIPEVHESASSGNRCRKIWNIAIEGWTDLY